MSESYSLTPDAPSQVFNQLESYTRHHASRVILAAGLVTCLKACEHEGLRSMPVRTSKDTAAHFNMTPHPYREQELTSETVSLQWGFMRHVYKKHQDTPFKLARLFYVKEDGFIDTVSQGLYIAQPNVESDQLIPFLIVPANPKGTTDPAYRLELIPPERQETLFAEELFPAGQTQYINQSPYRRS